jgi:TPR repeat protein
MKAAAALLLAALLLATALAVPAGAQAAGPDAAQQAWRTGLAYRNGTDRNKDAAQAVVWLRRAAQLGEPGAMFILAQMLAAGEGAPADPREAQRWLEAAAEADYPEALQQLALEERDPQLAALLMKRAAHALGHRALKND